MGLPVKAEPFSCHRVSDVEQVVSMLARAAPAARIFAVGWSMGGIVLANYMATAGADCPLAAGVSVSGSNDQTTIDRDAYSCSVWQPLVLRATLQQTLALPGLAMRGVDMGRLRAVSTAAEFHAAFSVPYFGFADLDSFYAAADVCSAGNPRKACGIQRPLLYISALDDPIFDADTLHAEDLSRANPHLSFLVTGRGGHCGWASGWSPLAEAWEFPSRAALDFILAVCDRAGGASESCTSSGSEDERPRARGS
jgi:predicted alpha/beta-fold hydrolase